MDTREKIITTSLTLFAKKGFETVSIRDIINKAKVNLAAISYHFGGKEALITEASARIIDPVNLKRSKLLKKAISRNGGIENTSLKEILEAFLIPIVTPKNPRVDHPLITKLAARFTTDENAKLPESSLIIYQEVLVTYAQAILAKLPHLTVEEIRTLLVFTSGAAIQYITMAPMAAALTGEKDTLSKDKLLASVLSFTLHGFDAKKG